MGRQVDVISAAMNLTRVGTQILRKQKDVKWSVALAEPCLREGSSMLKSSVLIGVLLVLEMSSVAFSQEPENTEPPTKQTSESDHQDSDAGGHASPEMREMA